jgi:hypothetical protein
MMTAPEKPMIKLTIEPVVDCSKTNFIKLMEKVPNIKTWNQILVMNYIVHHVNVNMFDVSVST